MKFIFHLSLFVCLLASSTFAQNATIRVNNHTAYGATIILEGTDDTYAGCSPSTCSWIESNPIFAFAGAGWVTFSDPGILECATGWNVCSFTGYGACAGSGTPPSAGSWTTIWRNARIQIAPGSGCMPRTTCLSDPTYGTMGGSCSGTFTSGCSNYITWTRTTSYPGGEGDQIDIEIW